MGVSANAQTPATLTDLGTTARAPGADDVSQLNTSGETNMPDGLNYYTDNQSNHNAGEPGQTFRTGNNGTGYVELVVDPYFPNTVPTVDAVLKGRTIHAGGRCRVFLDGHIQFTGTLGRHKSK